MNSEIKMNVSSLIRKDGDKAIYVMFTDGDKEAEFIVPECRLLNNKGFTDEEIGNLDRQNPGLNTRGYFFGSAF